MTTNRKRPLMSERDDSICQLYPNIDDNRTSLPRCFCPEAKFKFLTLSHGNLRVAYTGEGEGKSPKDAGSVRTDNPIPPGTGLYYYEVYVVNKGRDGFIGIGFSQPNQEAPNDLNRLPGWDKDTYGYHGDDGNKFCASGSGEKYGPKFTSGDTIGCCINFIDKNCFFTLNGKDLGVAFRDLPLKEYYPTIGLQTPGEVVEANFGQKPFMFQDELIRKRQEMTNRVENQIFSQMTANVDHSLMNQLISSYLIHHGHPASAVAFAKHTGLEIEEEMQSIENRQHLQKLVLEGLIEEAIDETRKLYPQVLSDDPQLELFLRCQQFIELIRKQHSSSQSAIESQSESDSQQNIGASSFPPPPLVNASGDNPPDDVIMSDDDSNHHPPITGSDSPRNGFANGATGNGNSIVTNDSEDSMMDTFEDKFENCSSSFTLNGDTPDILHVVQIGRNIRQLADSIECSKSTENKLTEIFGLLAYDNPKDCPLKHLFDASHRENLCSMLNAAVLDAHKLPKQPPLHVLLCQTRTCLSELSAVGVGSAAFVSFDKLVKS